MKALAIRRAIRLVLASLILTVATHGAAQDQPAKKADKPAAKKAEGFRGRLPAYYAKVVTPEQRAEIYAVQKRHAEKIDALKAQLKAAIQQRDAEVEAVLSDEQKQKLADMIAEAKQKIASKKALPKKPAPKKDAAGGDQ